MEPIKALGVFFTYDKKLLHLKNFSEKIYDIKKLINIWSSRGLSIYGKVTLIKSLIIPKIVYISLLPTPEHIIKELNQLLYKFLWKGKDKVTRASAINNYEEGAIKMIDIESLIKSLRLSWLKSILDSRALLRMTGGERRGLGNPGTYTAPDSFTAETIKTLLIGQFDTREKLNLHREFAIAASAKRKIHNSPNYYLL